MTPGCGHRPCEGQIQAAFSTTVALGLCAAPQVSWGLGGINEHPRAYGLVGAVDVKQTGKF